MKLITIFDSGDFSEGGGLLSVLFEQSEKDEFQLFFDKMRNRQWLFDFFKYYNSELLMFYPNETIETAIEKTQEEIDVIENSLLHAFRDGVVRKNNGLDQLFRPLHNYEYSIRELQKSKTKASKHLIRNPWCRLYAIRIEKNLFVITGGGIKLSDKMNQMAHLNLELKKISMTQSFLRSKNIITGQDLNEFYENDQY